MTSANAVVAKKKECTKEILAAFGFAFAFAFAFAFRKSDPNMLVRATKKPPNEATKLILVKTK